MGLTLHYRLKGPLVASDDRARALATAMRTAAQKFKRAGRIAAVGTLCSEPETLRWVSEWMQVPVPGEAHTVRAIEVPAATGLIFHVDLGEGSEPLRLGLCRYPARVKDPLTGRPRVVRRRGWRLSGSCKTQYASLHGWEHFRRCHVAAVDLLVAVSDLGVEVEINDEGGYWPSRDESELRRSVDRMNGIVAAFAGALKDVTDETGGAPVQSPIFAHPQFERLEAEGIARDGEHVRDAVTLTRRAKRPPA